jgi:hypothetical protein
MVCTYCHHQCPPRDYDIGLPVKFVVLRFGAVVELLVVLEEFQLQSQSATATMIRALNMHHMHRFSIDLDLHACLSWSGLYSRIIRLLSLNKK